MLKAEIFKSEENLMTLAMWRKYIWYWLKLVVWEGIINRKQDGSFCYTFTVLKKPAADLKVALSLL